MAHSGIVPAAPNPMPRTALLLATLLLLFAPGACAWGPAGHRMVAELAERRLAPSTRAQVRVLLRSLRADSLADVATWADDLRKDPKQAARGRATAPLHFVNFADAGCRYAAARDCAGGRCVVEAVAAQARRLGDRALDDLERADALRLLVHFVADVHQPLHAGYRDDRGGNRYQVQFDGKGSNLHSVWDSPVLASRGLGWRRQADVLARMRAPRGGGTPAQWAEESCRITRGDGFYPDAHRVGQAYLARMRPLAERRVREAGVRLADLIERSLAPASGR